MWMSHTSPADRACWQRYKCGGEWFLPWGDVPTRRVETVRGSAYQMGMTELQKRWDAYDAVWREEMEKAAGDSAAALRAYLGRVKG